MKSDNAAKEKRSQPAPAEREFWRPSNLLYPLPAVLVTCADEEGHANVMTAAWTGTVCSDPVMVYVSIRPSRFSHDIIERTGEFVINLTTRKLVRQTDYAGVRSGRKEDKIKALHLHPYACLHVAAPGILESPVSLECKVTQILRLGSHDMFLARVLSTDIDPRYLDSHGRFDLDRADLIAYSHGEYRDLGAVLGTFGFSVKKQAGGNFVDKSEALSHVKTIDQGSPHRQEKSKTYKQVPGQKKSVTRKQHSREN